MQSINPSPLPTAAWLDAREALALLGVRPQSLYASVSRGRIRSKPDANDSRRHLYSRDDVLRLAARRAGAAPAREVAEQAVAWGEPVLASAVSAIVRGQLWYAGRSAVQMAREQAGLEQVAALLWGVPHVTFVPPRGAAAGSTRRGLREALARMAEQAADGRPSRDREPRALQLEAAGLVASLADAWLGNVAGTAPPLEALHERIARRWRRPAAADAVRQALVLLADHELNASTFATRVAVSTGATLAAALLAGLATLTGPLHGGAPAELRRLLEEAQALGCRAAVQARLRHGRPLPAFGHPLYPDGDPRAAPLLTACDPPAVFAELAAAVAQASGALPNVDFALAALAAGHQLPQDAPLALFAIGRSVGWMAHALEQVHSGALIRPRARYTGPALAGSSS